YGPRLDGQQDKGRLEGVLSVLVVAQNPPADAQHHGPMPLHQFGERRLVFVAGKALQKLGIRRRANRLRWRQCLALCFSGWTHDPPDPGGTGEATAPYPASSRAASIVATLPAPGQVPVATKLSAATLVCGPTSWPPGPSPPPVLAESCPEVPPGSPCG